MLEEAFTSRMAQDGIGVVLHASADSEWCTQLASASAPFLGFPHLVGIGGRCTLFGSSLVSCGALHATCLKGGNCDTLKRDGVARWLTPARDKLLESPERQDQSSAPFVRRRRKREYLLKGM